MYQMKIASVIPKTITIYAAYCSRFTPYNKIYTLLHEKKFNT